jgi:hypothetical protein
MAIEYKKPSQFSVATIAAIKTALGWTTKQDVLTEGAFANGDKTKLDNIAAGATANVGTVTGVSGTAPIVSSGGAAPAISINAATTDAAGSMSSTDKTKLDGIAAGAQVNVATNIGQGILTETTIPLTSSTGTGTTLPSATIDLAGLMSSADKTKLNGIAAGATANAGTVTGVTGTAPIASSGGATPAISISAATTDAAGSMSSTDKSKLDGIEASADVTDAANVGAVNHAAQGKTTPVDADTLPITDTEATNVIKKLSFTNLKAFLKTYFDTLYGTIAQAKTEIIAIAVSDESTDLTIGTPKITFRMPYAMTLSGVRASVTTAPVGSTLIVNIKEGGTTILSTKLSIDASEKTSTTAASAAVISDTSLADDAEITIDIDQIGSSTAGKGLKVYLIGTRA